MIESVDQLKDIIEKRRNKTDSVDEHIAFCKWLGSGYYDNDNKKINYPLEDLPFYDELNYTETFYVKKEHEIYMGWDDREAVWEKNKNIIKAYKRAYRRTPKAIFFRKTRLFFFMLKKRIKRRK